MKCRRKFRFHFRYSLVVSKIDFKSTLEQLQNTPQLIYTSLNKNSVYCVMPRSSKPPDTCKWGGPELQGILKFSLNVNLKRTVLAHFENNLDFKVTWIFSQCLTGEFWRGCEYYSLEGFSCHAIGVLQVYLFFIRSFFDTCLVILNLQGQVSKKGRKKFQEKMSQLLKLTHYSQARLFLITRVLTKIHFFTWLFNFTKAYVKTLQLLWKLFKINIHKIFHQWKLVCCTRQVWSLNKVTV